MQSCRALLLHSRMSLRSRRRARSSLAAMPCWQLLHCQEAALPTQASHRQQSQQMTTRLGPLPCQISWRQAGR